HRPVDVAHQGGPTPPHRHPLHLDHQIGVEIAEIALLRHGPYPYRPMTSPEQRTAHPAAPPADRVFPLGAHLDETTGRARFAVASSSAEAVQLCLVDPDPDGGAPAEKRVELTERTFGVWHGVVAGLRPGQRYGYRVHGRYD